MYIYKLIINTEWIVQLQGSLSISLSDIKLAILACGSEEDLGVAQGRVDFVCDCFPQTGAAIRRRVAQVRPYCTGTRCWKGLIGSPCQQGRFRPRNTSRGPHNSLSIVRSFFYSQSTHIQKVFKFLIVGTFKIFTMSSGVIIQNSVYRQLQ